MPSVPRLSLFVLLSPLLLAGCSSEEAPATEAVRPVRAIKAADAGMLVDRSFPGRAKATQEVDLSFRVAGPLIVLPDDIVGRHFKKGELVARIDPRDYEVELENAQGQLARAEASLRRATDNYNRELSIFNEDPGATSEAAVERKLGTRDTSTADVKALKATVAAAEDRLAYTYLNAPFEGGVVSQYVQNFEHVNAKQGIVRIVDDSRVEMVVNIPESLISNLPYISNVRVVFDAFPDVEVPATIKEVGREASKTTRTYPVNLVMEQPEGIKILPGMAGRASADKREPDQGEGSAIVVPISAIFSPEQGDKSFVWVGDAESSTVSRREVTIGELTDTGVPVLDGLEPGDWVVTAGVSYLKEGQKVKLMEGKGY
jgi:RND family efflux transporter MFP subunit